VGDDAGGPEDAAVGVMSENVIDDPEAVSRFTWPRHQTPVPRVLIT
jgi:hypothetical protein